MTLLTVQNLRRRFNFWQISFESGARFPGRVGLRWGERLHGIIHEMNIGVAVVIGEGLSNCMYREPSHIRGFRVPKTGSARREAKRCSGFDFALLDYHNCQNEQQAKVDEDAA